MKQMKKVIVNILLFSLLLNNVSFAKIKAITIKRDNSDIKVVEEETTAQEETTVQKEEAKQEETKSKQKQKTAETTTIAGQSQATNTSNVIMPAESTPSSALKKANEDLIAANLAQQKAMMEQANRIAALQQELKEATTPMSYAGVWTREDGFWVFYEASANTKLKMRFLEYGGKNYWFDQLGHMATGWKYINGKWYYFDKNGAMVKGWFEYSTDAWYYLDPETGVMQTSDRIIDGELYNFSADGLWVKNINQVEQASLAAVVKSQVRYVKNKNKLQKVNADSEYKKKINKIIDSLPKDVLSRMASQLENIYICMNQDDESKNYLRSVGYKDEDGTRNYEYLPFMTTKTNIFINGNNEFNLYYGIGEWLAKTIKYKMQALYNTAVWKVIYSNNSGDIDCLLALTGTNGLIFYTADQLTSLACAIGWFLMNPSELKEVSDTSYKFIAQYIDITVGSPLIYE